MIRFICSLCQRRYPVILQTEQPERYMSYMSRHCTRPHAYYKTPGVFGTTVQLMDEKQHCDDCLTRIADAKQTAGEKAEEEMIETIKQEALQRKKNP